MSRCGGGEGGRTTEHALHAYVQRVESQRLSLNPLFWPEWYAETFADDLGASGDPFTHYLTEGWLRGAAPNPLFDVAYYVAHHMGEAEGTMSPLEHFVECARREATWSPHPLFDGAHYKAQLVKRGEKPKGSLYAHYLMSGDAPGAPSPHTLFWPDFYRDGAASGEALDVPALVHYICAGQNGADPNPYFCRRTYMANAPDVAAQGVDPLCHYVTSGAAENRVFHPLFDAAHYAAQGSVQAPTVLEDYLTRGMRTGRVIRKADAVDETTIALAGSRDVMELSLSPSQRIDQGQGGDWERIGIFAHIFYPDLAEEMAIYCNNAPEGRTTVFISTDTASKARRITAACKKALNHPFEVRVCDNRGRDIAPWLVGFADRMKEVDVGVHIHSKSSPQYGGGFAAWRRYLLDQTLGSPSLVENILDILAVDGVGAYCPDHHPTVRPLIQWGGNFETCKALVGMMGAKLNRRNFLDMPSGSMFWFRTDALRPLLDLALQTGHFDPEAGQEDGTLAHAVERCLLISVEIAGYSYVTGLAKAENALLPLSWSQVQQMANRSFPCARDLGDAAPYLPHCAGYLAQPSDVMRPRFNLLIPTADMSRAYAGVATGLEVFQAIRQVLGASWDGRIIATDMDFGPGFVPPEGYAVAGLDAPDAAGHDVALAGVHRRFGPMNLRAGDVFMATAWWTALQARGLIKQQQDIWGQAPGKFAYLVQDYENGFQAWSTAWALADGTYRDAERVLPIFNTRILRDFFYENGYPLRGPALDPALNATFAKAMERNTAKEKLVLLYARPHAERNCLSFIDMMVAAARARDPELWRDWRFLAIGEDFNANALKCNSGIEVLGRLTLEEYAKLASRAALGVSLMVSPHPSYPPLEMAAAGVRVLTNSYAGKDLSQLHPNIESFDAFAPDAVAQQLQAMARAWEANETSGWTTKPKIDWFFGGGTNLVEVANEVGEEIRHLAGPMSKTLEVDRWPSEPPTAAPFLKAAG